MAVEKKALKRLRKLEAWLRAFDATTAREPGRGRELLAGEGTGRRARRLWSAPERVIVCTTFPESDFDVRWVLDCCRLRWQVEPVFKRFQSLAEICHPPRSLRHRTTGDRANRLAPRETGLRECGVGLRAGERPPGRPGRRESAPDHAVSGLDPVHQAVRSPRIRLTFSVRQTRSHSP